MSALPAMDGETVKLGLIMETVQSQQRVLETALHGLKAHLDDLEPIVREQVDRAMADVWKDLSVETTRAAQAMRDLQGRASIRVAIFGTVVAAICTALPVTVGLWLLPGPERIESLRREEERLSERITSLKRDGANIEWRRCGDVRRLCLRIDRRVPAFGDQADFVVPMGY